MKCVLTMIYIALVQLASAQDFSYSPARYSKKSTTDPGLLAKQITAGTRSDRQKVEAIFRWITDNISYKTNPSLLRRRTSFYADDDDTGALKPLNERVSEKVLEEGEAFCEGYARLFSTLCSYAGIRSEVVIGYVRDGDRAAKTFRTNHSWNAVFIDSAWHLLDVTWASGFITFGSNRFVRHYDDYFFLTPPSQLIRTHYPEDIQWTLLPSPPTIREFESSPFKMAGFYTRSVRSYAPAKGVINAAPGDTLYFDLDVDEPQYPMYVVDATAIDSLPLSQVEWWQQPAAANFRIGKRIRAAYVVNPGAEWLHVVYNNAVVLRYRLQLIARD